MIIEDLEKLFPLVDFHFGIPTFLNGGTRPKLIDYNASVFWSDVLACGLAEHLCPLIGRLLTKEDLLRAIILSKGVLEQFSRAVNMGSTQWAVIAFVEDGEKVYCLSNPAHGMFDVKTGKVYDYMLDMPVESHSYNLMALHKRLKKKAHDLAAQKGAVDAAAKELADHKRHLEESGVLRNDLTDDPDRPVRDGCSGVDAGDSQAGAS
jgi:hypothetical protein